MPGQPTPPTPQTPPQAPLPEQPEVPQPVQPQESPQPQTNWQFTPENAAASSDPASMGDVQPQDATAPTQNVSWTASEFIDHHKSAGWYILLIIVALVCMAVVYFLTKDILSTVVIAIMLGALGVFAARKPRTLSYVLGQDGLQIESRAYPYDTFKSFSVLDEGAVHSITFAPMKRFMPPLSIYFDPKDEEAISNTISAHLPVEPNNIDFIERLMRRIHF